MTNDDIMPAIKNAAATYNLIGSFNVSFSGSGDSFSDFDNVVVTCKHCDLQRSTFQLIYDTNTGYKSSLTPHVSGCPCSESTALAAEFEQQALDVVAFETHTSNIPTRFSTKNLWEKEDLLFQIIDLDDRADFNNEGSCGEIHIYFNTLKIEIEVSQYEQVCNDLGSNTYDNSYFTGVKEPEDAKVKEPSVDVDALGDFKTWLKPS